MEALAWEDVGGLLGEKVSLFFTDRDGGISPEPYDSLNLALHTGDDPANVHANRAAVARHLRIRPEHIIYMEQVHGVRVLRAGWDNVAEGEEGPGASLSSCDGAYTTARGVALAVLTADCLPVALAFPGAGAVAVLHAGWRGTIEDIVGVALRKMSETLGVEAADARAVLGPAIAPCCYEVDEGRARLFVERYGRKSAVIGGDNGRYLDLYRANTLNLLEAGVKERNVRRVRGCTCCDRRYFSYRRDGVTGRQGAFVFLRP